MYNLTKCALCGNEAELELSHTVPKMAVRTLKKTEDRNCMGFSQEDESEKPEAAWENPVLYNNLSGWCHYAEYIVTLYL